MAWIKKIKSNPRSSGGKQSARQKEEEELKKLDDDDEVVLSYEEEVTLRHASQLPHSSLNYAPVIPNNGNNKRLTTVTPTGNLSIESMLRDNNSSSATQSNSSSQQRRGLKKRLSRLSFIGQKGAAGRTTHTVAEEPQQKDGSTIVTTDAMPPLSPPQSIRNNSSSSPSSSSMIFERSVQDFYSKEECSYHGHNDDYVPPVLDASTSAITDNKLSPDQVDVVSLKHNNESSSSNNNTLPPSPSLSNKTPPNNSTENDRYVLSFCSFADIVNSEAPTPPAPSSPQINSSIDDEQEVSVSSMSETLRRNTGESIKTH